MTQIADFQRLKIFRKSLNIMQGEFADSLGLQQGSYSDIERGRGSITYNLLKKLVDSYNVNPVWLMEGEGDMTLEKGKVKGKVNGKLTPENEAKTGLNEPIEVYNIPQKPPNIEVKVVTVDNTGRNNIVMIDAKAAAGLPTRLNDPVFYKDLPTFTLPGHPFNSGHQICLQIEGDSMHPTIEHGDYIICRELESGEAIRNGFVYIVVTHTSAVCKRAYYTKGKDFLNLHSDNRIYSPYRQPLSEVLKLYMAVANISTSFRNPNDALTMRLEALENDLQAIKQRLDPAD